MTPKGESGPLTEEQAQNEDELSSFENGAIMTTLNFEKLFGGNCQMKFLMEPLWGHSITR